MLGIVTDKDNYGHVRLSSLRYIPEKNVWRSWKALQFIDIYGVKYFFRKQIHCTQISYKICMCGGFEYPK